MESKNERKFEEIVKSDAELSEKISNMKRQFVNTHRYCRNKSCLQPFSPNLPYVEKEKGWWVQEKFTHISKVIYNDQTIRIEDKDIKICVECVRSYKTKYILTEFII